MLCQGASLVLKLLDVLVHTGLVDLDDISAADNLDRGRDLWSPSYRRIILQRRELPRQEMLRAKCCGEVACQAYKRR